MGALPNRGMMSYEEMESYDARKVLRADLSKLPGTGQRWNTEGKRELICVCGGCATGEECHVVQLAQHVELSRLWEEVGDWRSGRECGNSIIGSVYRRQGYGLLNAYSGDEDSIRNGSLELDPGLEGTELEMEAEGGSDEVGDDRGEEFEISLAIVEDEAEISTEMRSFWNPHWT